MRIKKSIRIGTRASALAIRQAEETQRRLSAFWPEVETEIVPMTTTGDKITDRTLIEAGGKGLFTKEIEEALLAGDVDIAVHSMKDMPTALPGGLIMGCLFEREDPRDALIMSLRSSPAEPSRFAPEMLQHIPQGAVFGTASLRRAAQMLLLRPDLTIVALRGNVPTRLRKVAQGEVQGALLAMAGLKRLGMLEAWHLPLPPEVMLPAVAQGAIGVECRADDSAMLEMLRPLAHTPTEIAVTAERALLAELDGSCRTPIAAYADLEGEKLRLRALIALPDGSECHRAEETAPLADAARLGAELGKELRQKAGQAFFAKLCL